jgi:serine phosphatase RsbU (regulator of sigma subunit)
MDIALSVIDNQNNMLYYAGAYNPAYVIREKELHEIKADRMPIGVHAVYQDTSFSVKTFQLKQGDKLYLFSDGFYDQFGGEKGLKFGRKAFKEMLLSIHEEPMQQQSNLLENRLEEWMGSWTQIDDIMIVGIHYDQANGKDAQG